MGAPFEDDGAGRSGPQERRQQGLGDETDGPGAAGFCRHIEKIVACLGSAGLESEGLTAHIDPGGLRLRNAG